ncbi:hypothetical protein ABID21_002486 [Pseudorhizobium tarimense]|uniref:DUF930 domain-containing protein n=1 Tax=Pseudorhizobium tarimense TaxID=1079109 RepID=A0ABV2H794_9HYPH|nr:DUF930 domain-containing protein [Pseudorhizobium tarimense]MCJ8519301.1 DUF930 domain-containing protein [Pseudorhizobium tarimense]
MRWGIPASFALHVVLAAILILGLPLELPVPPEEEAVTVEIVERPPEPEPPPEPAPEAEPQPEAAEEPPPPPAEEEQAPEPPPPPPETAAEEESAEASPIPTLRPVFEFGEETPGPKESPEGNASAGGPEAPPEPETPPEPEAEAEPQENPQAEAPEALAAETATADAAEPATAPPETVQEPSEAEGQSTDEPVETLTEAKVLFSEEITEDPVARTAMEDLPRSMRATQLCETELTEQLRNASPPQDPDFIPRSPLSEGTVLELRQTAFRAKGQWYDLSFRCEINEDATKVMRFAFDIGAPVPRSEWRRRGFPGT